MEVAAKLDLSSKTDQRQHALVLPSVVWFQQVTVLENIQKLNSQLNH